MTAVRLVDSAKYGFKLFAYLVVVTAVGGGALALGSALAWPEVQALQGPAQASKTDLAAGGILAFLGGVVLVTGYVGSAYKLVADAVATGTAAGGPAVAKTEADAAAEADEPEEVSDESTSDTSKSVEDAGDATAVPGAEPTEATTAQESGVDSGPEDPEPASADAGEPTASGWESNRPEGTAAQESEAESASPDPEPREPTAEEIAFGSAAVDEEETDSAGEAEEDDQSSEVETEVQESSGSVKPAARDAPSDPLGDRGGGS